MKRSTTEPKKARGGDSRGRIVETTARLLRVQGYHATGLNQIIDESQAPKGSLYHYFPQGKEELAGEAMRLAGEVILNQLRRLIDQNPAEVLDTLVEEAIRDLQASDYQHGCPLATVALEAVGSSPAIREICAEIFNKIQTVIEESLRRQGAPEEKLPVLAMSILATYEGALMLSKVHRNPAPLRQVVPQIKALMRSAQDPKK